MSECVQEAQATRDLLKKVPDLERLLLRVHSNGLSRRELDHPESRAVMFESGLYNKRKIKVFADILEGFEKLLKVPEVFAATRLTSPLLQRIVKAKESAGECAGAFPTTELTKLLKYFRTVFDEREAKREGIIKPKPGMNPAYDQAKSDMSDLEREMEDYLKQMKQKIGLADLNYFGTGKDRFQLEVPMAHVGKVPRDWTTKSQKKSHRRYRTAFIEDKLNEFTEAESR